MTDDDRKLLSEAVSRQGALVLSLPDGGLLRHLKSRFLSTDNEGFWICVDAAHRALLDRLIGDKKLVGISFKSSAQKVIFASSPLAFDAEHPVNAKLQMSAVKIAQPATVKAIQRRASYRVRVFGDSDLSVQVARISDRASLSSKPTTAQTLLVDVYDISAGGLGVVFHGKAGKPPLVCVEDRLRIELRRGKITLLLEGRMRTPAGGQKPGEMRTGIRFKPQSDNLQGRQTLAKITRLVGELQREEIRRIRLGLVS